MDNQHRKIKGYRELTPHDIAMMNRAKDTVNKVGELIAELEQIEHIDKRWLEIAKTDIQKGGMALVRSIAQPQTFA